MKYRTEAKTRTEIVVAMIVDSFQNTLEAHHEYNLMRNRGVNPPSAELCASVNTLFRVLATNIQTKLSDDDYAELKELARSRDAEDALRAFDTMSEFLYQIKLFKLDTRKKVDRTIVENTNPE